MSDIMESLFGPLGPEYCLWFYFLSILGYIMFIVFLLTSIGYGISKKKGVEYYLGTISVAAMYFVYYFQNRLLHTMCIDKQ